MFDVNNCFTHDGAGGLVQTITGDAASTNYIDLDAANLNIAAGKPIFLIVKSIAAFNTLTSLDIKLETDTDSGFATALKDVQTWNILLANLSAGATLINQALPVQQYQRYMRLYWNVVGANPTLGTMFACLSDAPEAPAAQLDLVDVA